MSCSTGSLPLQYDINLYRHDSYSRTIRLRGLDDNGNPSDYYDLTGCTILAQVRQYPGGPVTMPISAVAMDQTTHKGSIILQISPAEHSVIPTGMGDVGRWDLQITSLDLETTTYLAGKVTMREDISNA